MNAAGILGYLLAALGAAGSPSDAPAAASPPQRTIEILVAGPEDARNRMLATIQPLLVMTPDLRWVTRTSLPTEDSLPGATEGRTAQIWIDVSNLTQLRVYFPEKTKGGATVRTLANAGSGGEDIDPMAREAVAQIVKASVLALREMPAQPGKSVPASAVEKPPDSSPRGAPGPDGLYLRTQAGLGYLRTSESSHGGTDVFSGFGPTLDVAVGRSIGRDLILYGEFVMTAVRNADWPSQGPVFDNGPGGEGRDLLLLGGGPGVAYDFPFNLYASATLVFSKLWFLNANTDNPPPDTDWGIGGSVTIGKQWWLTRNWKMGIAVQFNDNAMTHHLVIHPTKSPEDIAPWMNATTFALLGSATWN